MFCVRQTTATRLPRQVCWKKLSRLRHEILEFVLPEEDRVRRLFELSAEPRPLEDELEDDVDEPAGLMAVLQQREIADDDLASHASSSPA